MPDLDFYVNVYLGDIIPVESLPEYFSRAWEQLRQYERMYTVHVPHDMPDGKERAICAMAESLYSFDLIASGEGGPVQSVDISPERQAKELYRCARRYLDIYRGVG